MPVVAKKLFANEAANNIRLKEVERLLGRKLGDDKTRAIQLLVKGTPVTAVVEALKK